MVRDPPGHSHLQSLHACPSMPRVQRTDSS